MAFLIIIFLILLNGIFSMSEIALVSSRKFKLESAAKKGNKKARKALDLSNNPNTFLSTVQIGITLVSILLGIFSGEEIERDLQASISTIELLAPYAGSISIITIVIIITFFSIVFGELIPKRIGLLFPEQIATFMATPMVILSKIMAPFIWLLIKTNDAVLRLFGIKQNMDNRVTEEEIKAMIQDSTDGGEIKEIEQDIVERVFALGDRRISELMTHRTHLIWLDIKEDLDTVRGKIKNEIHSVYPVAKGRLDDLAGIVHVKDLFVRDLNKGTFNLGDYIKKPLIVHDNTPAYTVLEKFRETREHNAIVVDEYGSVQGIVSMDDVLDALIGDVSENRNDEYQIVAREDGESWLADAQYPFFEFLNYFDLQDLDDDDAAGDFNTLAGLVLNSIGRIPNIGEVIEWRNFEIEVVDMDGLRIDKVMIRKNDAID
jgi:putative hemolysin